MYIPSKYQNTNLAEVKDFIKAYSFGILVSTISNRPWASHIPLELETDMEGNDILYGHISKANEQSNNLHQDSTFMAVFNGPHSYISSSWYGFEEVPTWNYIAVHIYGKLTVLSDDELLFSLKKLVDKYESTSEHPVRIENLSEKTMRQVKGIVGFKMTLDEIYAAFKISQGHNNADYHNIVTKLLETGDALSHKIAEIMKQKRV